MLAVRLIDDGYNERWLAFQRRVRIAATALCGVLLVLMQRYNPVVVLALLVIPGMRTDAKRLGTPMNDPDPGEMRDHYDFGPESKPIRGKYAAEYRRGTNVLLIDPDVDSFVWDAWAAESRRCRMCSASAVKPGG